MCVYVKLIFRVSFFFSHINDSMLLNYFDKSNSTTKQYSVFFHIFFRAFQLIKIVCRENWSKLFLEFSHPHLSSFARSSIGIIQGFERWILLSTVNGRAFQKNRRNKQTIHAHGGGVLCFSDNKSKETKVDRRRRRSRNASNCVCSLFSRIIRSLLLRVRACVCVLCGDVGYLDPSALSIHSPKSYNTWRRRLHIPESILDTNTI